ncbi:MAG: hypothetical protein RLZZ175_3221, partial [Bacteroidota bacterium]
MSYLKLQNMRFLNRFLYAIIICLSVFSCKHKTEYFIYSQHQLLDSLKQVEINNLKLKSDLPPTPKDNQFTFEAPSNFYTELVIILDSSDKVYIYQNQQIINNKDF